ncbi:MAG: hypothetical protein RLZZ248_1761 [Bacteroidota bacterium]
MFRITDVVKHLLVINILMFVASLILGDVDMLALHYPGSDKFQPYQIATHFFMHAGLAHIFFNMFALVMFGSALETLWGPKKFLFFYFISAFGAAALHLLYSYYNIEQLQGLLNAFEAGPSYDTFWAFFNETNLVGLKGNQPIFDAMSRSIRMGDADAIKNTIEAMNEHIVRTKDIPVVGASGAVYGLLLGFGMAFPNAELMLIFLPIPIKAKYFIPILMIAELFLGVNQFSWDNIAHFAHLGGAISGFLLILYWRKFGSRFDNYGQ